MDHQPSSILWYEGYADIVPPLTATMGWRVWRMEVGENSKLFYGLY